MSWSWTLAVALTFAASVHCVGMCGAFVLAFSAPRFGTRMRRLASAVLLQVGKASTYAFLGAGAGALGAGFTLRVPMAWGARLLALIAGGALVAASLTMLGLRGKVGGGRMARALASLGQEWLGPIVAARPAGAPLVVGMAMGFLPCPLVYAGLAAAAATGSAAGGALTMASVALGTVPALTLVALFGAAWRPGSRQVLARVAGVILLAAGLITASRAWMAHSGHEHASIGGAAGGAVGPESPDARHRSLAQRPSGR